MDFDMRALPKASRYKILGSCVTPRPIAWVTSRSADGLVNAAPYSFFNVLGDEPPTIALGMLRHGEGRLKDTPRNIVETGEFVVNLVSEDHGQAMNLTCIDAPADVSEVELAGLQLPASIQVAPPRIATAPASFECRVLHAIETGPDQMAVIGEVVHAHVRDEFIEDPERLYIDTLAMKLLARMHGAGWYSRQTDLIQMTRPTWAERMADGAA
ncbi:flavin reductase family protein [Sphingomonas oryzagri]|uniref:Flavin reductase family protein n=1 Tax=Sphingomonas oryzagri TaxID=3042314 RepID=A0ABT6N4B2_9SPHN|nr:flavin reductase family protein [Sphingomonas oryzagri]MDH7640002.1 flavin reductase family protein [Sphingomonas oryzagri]